MLRHTNGAHLLYRKLTQEELERREKETKLSEVDSKAVRSEEELRALKQKIRDIEEEMQQNEQTLKNEVMSFLFSFSDAVHHCHSTSLTRHVILCGFSNRLLSRKRKLMRTG